MAQSKKINLANVVGCVHEKLDGGESLKKKLLLILVGEAPYDNFTRRQLFVEHPIGWQPDLNDGMCLNIRPFVTAGVLCSKLNIKWQKERGKDVASAPWYHLFHGERINDSHLSLVEKQQQ